METLEAVSLCFRGPYHPHMLRTHNRASQPRQCWQCLESGFEACGGLDGKKWAEFKQDTIAICSSLLFVCKEGTACISWHLLPKPSMEETPKNSQKTREKCWQYLSPCMKKPPHSRSPLRHLHLPTTSKGPSGNISSLSFACRNTNKAWHQKAELFRHDVRTVK